MRPRGALEILEQSLALLREAPSSAIAAYLTGAIPFLLALLFFYTEMLRSPYASERLALESFTVAFWLLWKHVWQAIFAARLYRQLHPQPSSPGAIARMVAIQCAMQPLRMVVLPLSLLATVPFASVVAFFRNLGMLAAIGDPDPVASARKLGSLWTRQNWGILAVMSLAALLLFANVGLLLIGLPAIARTLLGTENDLTRLGAEGFLNPTTLALAAAIAWLAIDPLLTAVYVLRSFYGASVATGEDLSAALRRAIGIAAMLLLLLGPVSDIARAQPAAPSPSQPSSSLDVQRLDQSIDRTIHQREFAWRSPSALHDPPNRWTSWVREIYDAIVKGIRWLWQHLKDWLSPAPDSQGDRQSTSLHAALEVWTGAVVLVLVAGVAFFIFRRRRSIVAAVEAPAAATPAADLADESLTADRLPESSWRMLAEESLARGEFRLALRALYLAGLKYMSGRDLISIRRWKSGLDYRRELERRARGNPNVSAALVPEFARNVARFEQGWYGLHAVDRESVEALLAGLDEMRRHAERA